MIVQIVPSGESVQLSARSGSTSDVVTLPSLMAKRVSPRNMNREMAWLCPRVLEWGSRVSGSLAAMFRIFFWASASGAWTSPTLVSADSTTRHVASHAKRDIEFSRFVERSLGKRDRVPRVVTSIEDHHAERDSRMATSVESVWDGSTGAARCGAARPYFENVRDTIYPPLRRDKTGRPAGGGPASASQTPALRISPAQRSSTGSTSSAFAGFRLKTRRATPASR